MLFALTGVALFVVGFHGLVMHTHLLRKIMSLNVMGSGVFLVIGGLAGRSPGDVPDPVPHALVITGIVVAVAATALAIVLMLRVHEATGRPELPTPDRT
jgi:multicomponent Na+:H+ antiporter subunit C